jgi:peptide/nickel transport system permease protein
MIADETIYARDASTDVVPSRGVWSDGVRRLLRSGPALLGLALTAVFILAALLAPIVAPYDPTQVHLAVRLQGPSAAHWFGTDTLGRDEFSRVLYGARTTLSVAGSAVLLGVVMGCTVGATAGTLGGLVDTVLMRVIDALLAVPGILLAIGIVTWLGQGLLQIMVAVAISTTPLFARLLRSNLLSLRAADFVIAARSRGASRWRILVRHMLPNAVSEVIVAATLTLATAIIDVAGLGFLGLGSPDPRIAEWGAMLTSSTEFLQTGPYLIFFPGAAIVLTVIGVNLLGDGLRESLDPRRRR